MIYQFFRSKKDKDNIEKLIETNFYIDEVNEIINQSVINNLINEDIKNEFNIRVLDIQKYNNNQFSKSIKIENLDLKDYQIKNSVIKKGTIFLYDDIEVIKDDYYLTKNKLGYFKEDYKYIELIKNGITWMSNVPHEINTIKKYDIKKDKIYVFGLGLGYFPFINKDNFDKFVIIEKDKSIIELFNKTMLHNFNKNQIEIINDDVFNVIKSIKKEDYIYVDLYHDVSDGLEIYIKLNKLLKDNCNVSYWIEESLIEGIRKLIINLIYEELYLKNKVDYTKNDNFIDSLMNKLHLYFYKYKVSKYEDILNILSNDYIKKLIKEL